MNNVIVITIAGRIHSHLCRRNKLPDLNYCYNQLIIQAHLLTYNCVRYRHFSSGYGAAASSNRLRELSVNIQTIAFG